MLLFNADGADTDGRGRLLYRAHGKDEKTTSFVLQKVHTVSNVATKFDLLPEMHSLIQSFAR